MLPEDAGVGGGVGLLTSEVMMCNSINDMFQFYLQSYIHTLVSKYLYVNQNTNKGIITALRD
jgi:hypothetical protein